MNQRVGYCSPESRVETLRKSRNEDSTTPIIIYVKDPYLYGKKLQKYLLSNAVLRIKIVAMCPTVKTLLSY